MSHTCSFAPGMYSQEIVDMSLWPEGVWHTTMLVLWLGLIAKSGGEEKKMERKKNQNHSQSSNRMLEHSCIPPVSMFLFLHITLWCLLLVHPFRCCKVNGNQQLEKLALWSPLFVGCGVSMRQKIQSQLKVMSLCFTLVFPHFLVPPYINTNMSHLSYRSARLRAYTRWSET